MHSNQRLQYDVVIIGSGAAGATAALSLADHTKVAVIAKTELTDGSTQYAQGGIAAVLDATDSVEQHVADTLAAGAGLCDKEAVTFTVGNSRNAIEWLIDQGVPFTKDSATNGEGAEAFHLTREGGHSTRRIIHAKTPQAKPSRVL